jgi:multiple sugar transport system permease protein
MTQAQAQPAMALAERLEMIRKSKARGLMVRRVGRGVIYLLLLIGSAVYIFPFLFMLSTSLKTLSQTFMWPPQMIPKPFTLANYVEGWNLMPTAAFYKNTFVVAVLNIIGTVFSSTLVAYGFARLRFRGRNILFIILLSTMMLPGQVTMIPLYIGFSRLSWVGTLKPLWVPSFFGNPFQIFLLRQFLMTIPRELDDAAKIDGCGYIRTLVSIIAPLIVPALGVTAIFTFTGAWNDFMGPLIYLRRLETFTIAMGLRMFQLQGGTHMGRMMAMAVLALLPQIFIFFFAQRQMVQGVVLTGIKG